MSHAEPAALALGVADGFRSPHERRRWATWAIVGCLLVKGIYGVLNIWAQLIRSGALPKPFASWLEAYEIAGYVFSVVFLGSMLVAAALFIRWHRQLLRNLKALGCRRLHHGIEFASWAWFIPFVAWVVPYRSIAQAARFSYRNNGPNTPALVGLWWAVWISHGMINRVSVVLEFRVETVESWVRASAFELVALGIEGIAGLLVILMMGAVSDQQVEHAERLGRAQ